MKTEDPLLIYRRWFAELDLNLADDIAQALFQAVIPCKPRHKLLIKKEASQYPGLASITLLNIIDRQIKLRGKLLNQQFAMILHEVTRISLQTDGQHTPFLLEELKEQYIINLAQGDQAEASYFEQLIAQLSLESEQQNAWSKLEASGFNSGAIESYTNN